MHSRYSIRLFVLLTLLSRCTTGGEDPAPAWLLPGPFLEPPGTMRTYFTYPQSDAGIPDRFRARNAVLDRIHGAAGRIDAFVYGFNEPEMIAALRRARDRGIALRIIGSPDQGYTEAESAGLTIERRAKSGLQHVKLLLIDDRFLISGTGNFTRSGFFQNHNVFFERIVDPATAARVRRSLLFEDEPSLPAVIDLGPAPFSPVRDRAFFAPRHGRLIQREIVRAILAAKHSVRFLIFSYTDPVISAALYAQARRGIAIEGVFDDEFNRGELKEDHAGARLNAGLGLVPAVFYLEGNRAVTAEAIATDEDGEPEQFAYHGGHLHHKTLIIDDKRVLTGSYNWSLSARDRNLEILFDLHDPAVARGFVEEFERIRGRARILPRAPFDPEVRDRMLIGSAAPLHFEDYGGEILACVHANMTSLDLSIFSGRGAYFRGYHLPGGNACRDPGRPGRASFGPLSGTGYGLPASAGTRIFTGGPLEDGTAEAPRPCEFGCGILELHRAHPEDGWFWLKAPVPLRSVYVWNRGGFSAELSLQRVSGDFYRYPPPEPGGGDNLVFARDESGDFRLGCIVSGAGLDRGLQDFLDTFEVESGHRPPCIAAEL